MNGPIICGVDDSESAKRAARVARGLSTQLGSPLVFVRVVDDASDEDMSAVAALTKLAASATDVDCGAHWLVEVGHPADRLVAVAEDEAASLIVVGSTGPRSSLLGSISADVSRRAPCPVVVVAPGSDTALTNGTGSATFGRTAPPAASTPLGGPAPRLETQSAIPRGRASPAASSASTLAAAGTIRSRANRPDPPLGERRRSRALCFGRPVAAPAGVAAR